MASERGFEVGDRVRVSRGESTSAEWNGRRGEVAAVENCGSYDACVRFADATSRFFYSRELEPCAEPAFAVGDRVRWSGSGELQAMRGTVEAWTFDFARGMSGQMDDTQWRQDGGGRWHCAATSLEPLTEAWKVVRVVYEGVDDEGNPKPTLVSAFQGTTCGDRSLGPRQTYAPGKEVEQAIAYLDRAEAERWITKGAPWDGAACELWRAEGVVSEEAPPTLAGVSCRHLMLVERVARYRGVGVGAVAWPAPDAEREAERVVGGERLRAAKDRADHFQAEAERLEKECGHLRTLHGAADVLVNDLEASGAPNLRAHTVAWGGETFEIIVRRPEGKTVDEVLIDLRERLKEAGSVEKELHVLLTGTRAERDLWLEKVAKLECVRAADARLVEAAVALVRDWWSLSPLEVSGPRRTLSNAVAAHPSCQAAGAEPAPEPKLRRCANDRCGRPLDATKGEDVLCVVCNSARKHLKAAYEGGKE